MKRRLLVVDDEVLVARTLRRILAKEYAVDGETTAAAALGRIERGERWDAILIDVMLPDLDGRELYFRIAKIDPAQARCALFVTGTTADENTLPLLASGRVGWLTKPFSTAQLREELATIAARTESAAAAGPDERERERGA